MHWYALKVYFNRVAPIAAELREEGIELFDPSEAVPSLLLVRCNEERVARLGAEHWQQLWVYRQPGERRPAAVPDREVGVFRFVVTAGREGLMVLGDDRPEYHLGDRVRVTDGPFKGAEGHIRRIKKDRRLVVTIRGVVAVATTYIHPMFLEKI